MYSIQYWEILYNLQLILNLIISLYDIKFVYNQSNPASYSKYPTLLVFIAKIDIALITEASLATKDSLRFEIRDTIPKQSTHKETNHIEQPIQTITDTHPSQNTTPELNKIKPPPIYLHGNINYPKLLEVLKAKYANTFWCHSSTNCSKKSSLCEMRRCIRRKNI